MLIAGIANESSGCKPKSNADVISLADAVGLANKSSVSRRPTVFGCLGLLRGIDAFITRKELTGGYETSFLREIGNGRAV